MAEEGQGTSAVPEKKRMGGLFGRNTQMAKVGTTVAKKGRRGERGRFTGGSSA